MTAKLLPHADFLARWPRLKAMSPKVPRVTALRPLPPRSLLYYLLRLAHLRL